MTPDAFADLVETVHQAVITELKVIVPSTANFFDRIVVGPEGDIWSGLLKKGSNDVHTWMVIQSDLTPENTEGDESAPTGDFWPIIRFQLLGFYKYELGTAATNAEKTFRRERAKLMKHFQEKFNLNLATVARNLGFRSRFGVKRLSDKKLGYEIIGELTVVLQSVSRS